LHSLVEYGIKFNEIQQFEDLLVIEIFGFRTKFLIEKYAKIDLVGCLGLVNFLESN
jgi:hypothetical protein